MLRLTGVEGPVLGDVFPTRGAGPGIARSVASLEAGGTDLAGRRLARWDIRYIVVDTTLVTWFPMWFSYFLLTVVYPVFLVMFWRLRYAED